MDLLPFIFQRAPFLPFQGVVQEGTGHHALPHVRLVQHPHSLEGVRYSLHRFLLRYRYRLVHVHLELAPRRYLVIVSG